MHSLHFPIACSVQRARARPFKRSPFFSLVSSFSLPRSLHCFFSFSLRSVHPIIRVRSLFFPPPSQPLLLHFPAVMHPYCMVFSCSRECLCLSPSVSLALPPFLGNQLILCVSKLLCLRSSSLCFGFIQQGDQRCLFGAFVFNRHSNAELHRVAMAPSSKVASTHHEFIVP